MAQLTDMLMYPTRSWWVNYIYIYLWTRLKLTSDRFHDDGVSNTKLVPPSHTSWTVLPVGWSTQLSWLSPPRPLAQYCPGLLENRSKNKNGKLVAVASYIKEIIDVLPLNISKPPTLAQRILVSLRPSILPACRFCSVTPTLLDGFCPY